jgi:hypothetical protein
MFKRLFTRWLAAMEQQDLDRARQHIKHYTQGNRR